MTGNFFVYCNTIHSIVRLFAITILFCHSIVVIADTAVTTIESLQRADKLRINVKIEPQQNIIVKQQIKLIIEVATDKWFRGGTKIGRVEIDDAIVLQREKFAVNSTRQEAGKSWVVQQWTQVIYPQREGDFSIPAIPVTLSVAGENLEAIVGQLDTRPLDFSVSLPNELKNKTNWIVTNQFEIETNFDNALEKLKTGDAITRTIKLSAENLPAMMLPMVKTNNIAGIAIYHKPPQVSDKVNRGQYLAERVEMITYVFEKPGEYQLSVQRYSWWNLESDTLETIEVPQINLQVSSLTAVVNKTDASNATAVDFFGKWSLALVVIIITGFIGWKIVLYFSNKKIIVISDRYIQRELNNACKVNDVKKALQLFYQWLDLYGGDSFQGSVRVAINALAEQQMLQEFNTIMRSLYSDNKNKDVHFQQFATHFMSRLKQTGQARGLHRWDIKLNLN